MKFEINKLYNGITASTQQIVTYYIDIYAE